MALGHKFTAVKSPQCLPTPTPALTMGNEGLSLQTTLIVSLIADLGEPPVMGLLLLPEKPIVWLLIILRDGRDCLIDKI